MSTIKEQLNAAIGARKDSLEALRTRIADLLESMPIGAKLSDDNGLVVKVVRICTGASQWSNQTWNITIKGKGFIDVQGRLIAESIDGSYWDGSNMHVRSTEPTCLGCSDQGETLKWVSGKDTRALAARLPEAIARYMTECEAERAANTETLAR